MAYRKFILDNRIQDIWKKTLNGLDIYYAINNENIQVGINTDNPTATLDVSGDIKGFGDIYLTGDIYQNNNLFTGSITIQDEGSTLTTNATTLNFLGAGVTAFGSGTTKTISITDTIIDKNTDVSLNNLYVHGDISVNTGSIFSNGDISTNINLNVGENINAYNNVGIKNNLDVCGNVDIYGTLTTHELNINSTNINSTNVNISDNIIAIGYTDGSNIFDKGIVFNSIKDNSNHALLWKYDLSSFVLANVGDVSGANPPHVINNINNYSDLRIGNLITEYDISSNGNLSVQGNTNIYGNTTLQGNIYSDGDLSLNSSNLFVSGDISSNGNLSVQGNTNIYGNTTLQGNIYSNGDVYNDGQINTIDISCRSLHIENIVSNSRYITMEDDYNRETVSFTQKLISGINSDAVDLSMVGYAGGSNTEILLSTDPDTNSYIDVSFVGIGTRNPLQKLHIEGTSYIDGSMGIGTSTPLGKLHIYEAIGTAALDNNLVRTNTGSLILEHGDSGGTSSVLFKSTGNTSDFGAIEFVEDVTDHGSTTENAVLRIIAGNDGNTNTSDQIRFTTDENDRMTINGNGNIGIGTVSPGGQLHIYADPGLTGQAHSAVNGDLILEHATSNRQSRILFKNATDSSSYGAIQYNSGNGSTSYGALRLIAGDDTNDNIYFRTNESDRMLISGDGRFVFGRDGQLEIKSTKDVSQSFGNESISLQTYIDNNGMNNPGNFTNDEDRFRLCLQPEQGLVLFGSVNTTGSNGLLQITCESNQERQDAIVCKASDENNYIIHFKGTLGATKGKIRGNGTSNVAYDTSSDRRLKTNIENMDSQLDNIMNLQPRKYNWISDNKPGTGFIAQEVHNIYPEFRENYNETYCSDNSNFDYDCPCDASGNMWIYGLDYGLFTPYIVKAFQEYKTQTDEVISNLKERISALENN